MKKKFALFFLFFAFGVIILSLVPWHTVLERKIITTIENWGFEKVSLRAVSIGYSDGALADVTVTKNGITAVAGEVTYHKTDKPWQWQWEAKRITITGSPVSLPETNASGAVTMQDDIAVDGKWGSADNTYRAAFRFEYPKAHPDNAALTLRSFLMPWGGGTVAMENTVIPIPPKEFQFALIVKSVLIDSILKPLTGERASATGTVSGTLPFTYTPGGWPLPKAAALASANEGKIIIAPEAIPGDNPQVGLVRDVMKDFHYKTLSLSLDNKDKKVSATLSVEGNNPAVYDGRPVKLNVHLSGDVLDFVLQGMATSDPSTLLKQDGNAK